MSGSATLYTPEILSLAVELANFPFGDDLSRRGDARSQVCGSTIAIGADLDPDDRISRIGARVSACAIGQAAAALFLRSAEGKSVADIETAEKAIGTWLKGEGDIPDWPDLAILSPARTHPSRHGAILLPWTAARTALCNPAIAV